MRVDDRFHRLTWCVMSKAEVVQELAREVRRDTLKILAATENSWNTWAPEGTSNHILWHAGHAAWLLDLMCVEPITGHSELPEGWAATFGMNSQPNRVSSWPTQKDVQRYLESQLDRILELLSDVSDEMLSGPAPGLGGHRDLLGWILHGLHDEAKHSGEMYLLWKMSRSPTSRVPHSQETRE
jgi:hypothetical protein